MSEPNPTLESDAAAVTDGPAATSAGGLPAVTAALGTAWQQMGAVRSLRTLYRINQVDGFDCPGCAWPESDRRKHVEFCENGAKAVAEEATLRRIDRDFFARHSLEELARNSDHFLSQQGRIAEPLVLRPGATHYEPIDWDEAFELLAGALRELPSPDAAIFYTSGRTSNEAAFLYQLMVRLFGTNNLPDCSNLCHESSGVALGETLGAGKGSVLLADFEKTDCVLLIGQNPGTNHPRMLSTLKEVARRGCPIIAVNPLKEAGLLAFQDPQELLGLFGARTALATHFLQVRIGGDVALLKGLMKALYELDRESGGQVFDHEFLREHTRGFAAFAADLESESWERIVEGSGIERDALYEVARVLAASKRLICCWAMGLTQHKHAVANIQEIVNLLLLGGHVGREGAGACPVRGHSNVQGDRTMGIWERPTPAFLEALAREFGFVPPDRHGYDVVHAIEAMLASKIGVFFGMGGNFLSASPDTVRTAAALRNCALTAHVSTKLNRSHLITGRTALILPCLGRTERDRQAGGDQFVSVEDSMGVVHATRGRLNPASPALLSEVAIVCRLAERLLAGKAPALDWQSYAGDYDHIREHIARVVPGFEDMNRRIREPNGFVLPHAVRDERRFRTASGKAELTVHPIPRFELEPGQFLLTTIRSHDQFNTTVYGLDDRYRGIRGGRHVVFIRADERAALGFEAGATVDVVNSYGAETRRAAGFRLVDYDLPKRCLAAYFPEANVLVPLESFADKSHTPTSKSLVVHLEPHRPAAPAQKPEPENPELA
ncbi:MAG TPA: FdhF/YdeP family oxidoreductase [Polyangiaceae bacterium]